MPYIAREHEDMTPPQVEFDDGVLVACVQHESGAKYAERDGVRYVYSKPLGWEAPDDGNTWEVWI